MKNNFRINGQEVIIDAETGGRQYQILIDLDDLEDISRFDGTWRITMPVKGYPYAYVLANGRQILMHRLLLNAPRILMVDHINHNTLDNRRSNIRIVTNSENQQNRLGAAKTNKTSGVRGVYWDKQKNRWKTQVKLNGKKYFFGLFKTIDDANKAVSEGRKKLFKYSKDA